MAQNNERSDYVLCHPRECGGGIWWVPDSTVAGCRAETGSRKFLARNYV